MNAINSREVGMRGYRVKFGRTDGSAIKSLPFTARHKALRFANYLSYVLWGEYPFLSSKTTDDTRKEGNGFFISYHETEVTQQEVAEHH